MSKVVLWVSDLQSQANFYSRLFNAAEVQLLEEFGEVRDAENCLLLHLLAEPYRSAVPLIAPLAPQTEVAIKPVFTVEDISAALQRVELSFGSVIGDQVTYGELAYQDLVDPEGNVIQIQQRV